MMKFFGNLWRSLFTVAWVLLPIWVVSKMSIASAIVFAILSVATLFVLPIVLAAGWFFVLAAVWDEV